MTDREFRKWYKISHGKKFTGGIIHDLQQLKKYGFVVKCARTSSAQAERQAGNATQPESNTTKSLETVNPQADGQFASAHLLE